MILSDHMRVASITMATSSSLFISSGSMELFLLGLFIFVPSLLGTALLGGALDRDVPWAIGLEGDDFDKGKVETRKTLQLERCTISA